MHPLRMVPMTSLPPFQARLLAARLGAEGILWQLRGETALYPFAAVEVLVEADEVEHARALLGPMELQEFQEFQDADEVFPAAVGERTCRPHRRVQVLLTWLIVAVILTALALRITHLG